jgi:hypothetical protein
LILVVDVHFLGCHVAPGLVAFVIINCLSCLMWQM